MLEKNRDNIAKALAGLRKYELTQGEIVANGAYYNALVPNIQPAQLLQPFLDYAFGFRQRRRTSGNRRTTPDRAPNFPSPSTGFRNQETSPMMATRKRLATWVAVLLAVVLVAGAAFLVRQVFFGPNTITAYFPTATAIYPGDEVRVSGVKVGTIDSIEPEGTQTKMVLKVDRDVPVPADAKAVIVAQNLIAARYVQLTPAYRDGRRAEDGRRRGDSQRPHRGTGGMGRGQDPVDAAGNRIGTQARSEGAVTDTSIGRFIDSAANAMDGNGEKLRSTLAELSGVARIFAEGSGNIVDIIKNLQIFVTALRDSKQQIVHVPEPVGHPDQRAGRQQVRSGRGAVGPVGRDRRGAALRRRQPRTDGRADQQPGRRHPESRRQPDCRSRTSCTSRPTRSPTTRTSTTRPAGGVTGAFSFVNFSNPVYFVCGMIGAVANTTAPETAKLCEQYLGPALRLLNFNNLPLPINPYLRPSRQARGHHLHGSEAGARRRGPGRSARAAARGLGLHRRRGCGAAARLRGRRTTGDAAGPVRDPGSEVPATPSPALFPGAPIPGTAQHSTRPGSVRSGHAAAADPRARCAAARTAVAGGRTAS